MTATNAVISPATKIRFMEKRVCWLRVSTWFYYRLRVSIGDAKPLRSDTLAGMLRTRTAVRKRAQAGTGLPWPTAYGPDLQGLRHSRIARAMPGKPAVSSSAANTALIPVAMALPSSTPH